MNIDWGVVCILGLFVLIAMSIGEPDMWDALTCRISPAEHRDVMCWGAQREVDR